MDQKGLGAMLTSTQSAGVTPGVNLRITQVTNMQGIHPGFETQGRCHQKSKIGHQRFHKKDLCPPNCFKKGMNKRSLANKRHLNITCEKRINMIGRMVLDTETILYLEFLVES